ncbi:MAG: hypothetical protein RIQ60_4125 [Pseudomonadota bacterium]
MITDPWFYAAAVPAVFLIGLAKSGFGAGLGALATPLMALTISVPRAAAIMLPLLAVVDLLGLFALLRHADWSLLRRLLPAGLLGTLIGWASFGLLSATTVGGIVGALTLVFLALRLYFPPSAQAPKPGVATGWLLGATSGFTSFVAHSGGPPIAFYVLPLRLPTMVYTGTMAVFFTVINISKWIPYGLLGLLDTSNFSTSLVLAPVAPLGVWTGIHLAKRMNATLFYRIVYIGMFLTGLKLLFDAWRAHAG